MKYMEWNAIRVRCKLSLSLVQRGTCVVRASWIHLRGDHMVFKLGGEITKCLSSQIANQSASSTKYKYNYKTSNALC